MPVRGSRRPTSRTISASRSTRTRCCRSSRTATSTGAGAGGAGGDPSSDPAPVPPGPPFPDPETDRAVYDYAGILSPGAIVDAESTIDRIEERTGAEVVVYTQNNGGYPDTDET